MRGLRMLQRRLSPCARHACVALPRPLSRAPRQRRDSPASGRRRIGAVPALAGSGTIRARLARGRPRTRQTLPMKADYKLTIYWGAGPAQLRDLPGVTANDVEVSSGNVDVEVE